MWYLLANPKNVNSCQKRVVDTGCRVFKKTWTTNYLFTEARSKALRLVCGAQVAVFKDYNSDIPRCLIGLLSKISFQCGRAIYFLED